MSPMEIGFLLLVLAAFGVFAAALAYYSHHTK